MAHTPFVLNPARLDYKLEIKPGRVRNPRLRGINVLGDQYRFVNPFLPGDPGEVVQTWIPGMEGILIIDFWKFETSGCPNVQDLKGHKWTVHDDNGVAWEFWPEEHERDIQYQHLRIWGGLFAPTALSSPEVQPVALIGASSRRYLEL